MSLKESSKKNADPEPYSFADNKSTAFFFGVFCSPVPFLAIRIAISILKRGAEIVWSTIKQAPIIALGEENATTLFPGAKKALAAAAPSQPSPLFYIE